MQSRHERSQSETANFSSSHCWPFISGASCLSATPPATPRPAPAPASCCSCFVWLLCAVLCALSAICNLFIICLWHTFPSGRVGHTLSYVCITHKERRGGAQGNGEGLGGTHEIPKWAWACLGIRVKVHGKLEQVAWPGLATQAASESLCTVPNLAQHLLNLTQPGSGGVRETKRDRER